MSPTTLPYAASAQHHQFVFPGEPRGAAAAAAPGAGSRIHCLRGDPCAAPRKRKAPREKEQPGAPRLVTRSDSPRASAQRPYPGLVLQLPAGGSPRPRTLPLPNRPFRAARSCDTSQVFPKKNETKEFGISLPAAARPREGGGAGASGLGTEGAGRAGRRGPHAPSPSCAPAPGTPLLPLRTGRPRPVPSPCPPPLTATLGH